MSDKALAGLEALANLGKSKLTPKPAPVRHVAPEPEPEDIDDTERIVRVPRTTPASKSNQTQKLVDGDTLIAKNGFGKSEETELRREKILAWMLNGHLHDGQLMTVSELAEALAAPTKTVQNDVATLKEQMGEYHTTEDLKDVPALAHMLMEMKFQDRGRALALYNIIMGDINKADAFEAAQRETPQARKATGLTGRDRAAMYSAALAALDLSNKATNGMESLFKITGGAQRLAAIIKARNITVNNFNGPVFTNAQLQEVVANEMGAVLPSTRKVQPMLEAPTAITLDAADHAILAIGSKK